MLSWEAICDWQLFGMYAWNELDDWNDGYPNDGMAKKMHILKQGSKPGFGGEVVFIKAFFVHELCRIHHYNKDKEMCSSQITNNVPRKTE